MKMWKKSLLAVTAISVMTGFVGCSSDDEDVKTPEAKKYSITVNRGIAAPETAVQGDDFMITADMPQSVLDGDSIFDIWKGDVAALTTLDMQVTAAALGKMGSKDLTFTATYRGINDEPSVPEVPKTGKEIQVLDNFEKQAVIGGDDYTLQNLLGYTLGAIVGKDASAEGDSVSWGGGQWYAYASNTGSQSWGDTQGASVYSYGENDAVDTIIGVEETEPSDTENDPLVMFGDGTLSVVLDARETNADDGDYFAAVACGFAGDPEHMDGVEGAVVEEGDIFWDMSNLESVTIKMNILGAVNITFPTQATGDGSFAYSIRSEKTDTPEDAEDKEVTIELSDDNSDLKQPAWTGGTAKWSEVSNKASGIAIEIDTEHGNFASIKVEDIKLNFKDEAAKKAAFPFLAQ